MTGCVTSDSFPFTKVFFCPPSGWRIRNRITKLGHDGCVVIDSYRERDQEEVEAKEEIVVMCHCCFRGEDRGVLEYYEILNLLQDGSLHFYANSLVVALVYMG